ncbi:hypothetical protein EYF80_049001 [Liparis tanakae]|uniref:Uncharacterized protein n=1 Tax=Liparis tanakae TaxID=230148 RepID=A0A4Z2FHX6_9TELE|nr:hypothetical protein EYF80_049001 [Liparis tanakae]
MAGSPRGSLSDTTTVKSKEITSTKDVARVHANARYDKDDANQREISFTLKGAQREQVSSRLLAAAPSSAIIGAKARRPEAPAGPRLCQVCVEGSLK